MQRRQQKRAGPEACPFPEETTDLFGRCSFSRGSSRSGSTSSRGSGSSGFFFRNRGSSSFSSGGSGFSSRSSSFSSGSSGFSGRSSFNRGSSFFFLAASNQSRGQHTGQYEITQFHHNTLLEFYRSDASPNALSCQPASQRTRETAIYRKESSCASPNAGQAPVTTVW